jgi:2-iminobutanoate/2-iminopropanoate deaminase
VFIAIDEKILSRGVGPAPYPARTTCVVQALPDPKMLIEIEGLASLKA